MLRRTDLELAMNETKRVAGMLRQTDPELAMNGKKLVTGMPGQTNLELAMSHLLSRPQPLPEAKDVIKGELPPELAHQHAEGKHPGGHVQLLCTPQ